jgi:hypothetical protein
MVAVEHHRGELISSLNTALAALTQASTAIRALTSNQVYDVEFAEAQGRVVTKVKTAIPELSDSEMQALTKSERTDLTFAVLTATDNGGDEIGQVMFVVGDNGPLGYTPIGEPRPEPMIFAALVEQYSQQYGR